MLLIIRSLESNWKSGTFQPDRNLTGTYEYKQSQKKLQRYYFTEDKEIASEKSRYACFSQLSLKMHLKEYINF
jgi:hypothetical protein